MSIIEVLLFVPRVLAAILLFIVGILLFITVNPLADLIRAILRLLFPQARQSFAEVKKLAIEELERNRLKSNEELIGNFKKESKDLKIGGYKASFSSDVVDLTTMKGEKYCVVVYYIVDYFPGGIFYEFSAVGFLILQDGSRKDLTEEEVLNHVSI